MYTGIRLLLLIHSFIASFFFLSNFQALKYFVTLFIFLSLQFSKLYKFSSYFSQELWGLEGWNLIHTWTMGGCIVYTGIRLLLLIRPFVFLLAHLRRRLTRWAYSIAMVCRPSVVVVVHTFKPVYLWSQLANLDQILCVASLEWGKGCIRFWGRLDQNSGFHGNRKPPLSYNGKNNVSTFFRLFLIGSFLYLQVTRTCIKSRTSSNFHQIGPLTTELAALERLKKFP